MPDIEEPDQSGKSNMLAHDTWQVTANVCIPVLIPAIGHKLKTSEKRAGCQERGRENPCTWL